MLNNLGHASVAMISQTPNASMKLHKRPYMALYVFTHGIFWHGLQLLFNGLLLDFFNGFYHLELTARAREALAVVSKGGLYEWVCLPMGPVNGPQAFQAAMEKAFCSTGPGSGCRTVFIDDVTVYTGRAQLKH